MKRMIALVALCVLLPSCSSTSPERRLVEELRELIASDEVRAAAVAKAREELAELLEKAGKK